MVDAKRARVEEVLDQLDAAYSSGDWHSLRGNLADVPADAWDWLPPRGARSIRDIVRHVIECKLVYENHAFGDATLDWDDTLPANKQAMATIDEALAWLDEAHNRLRASIASLTDSDLDAPRKPSWWQNAAPARGIITLMIHHDVYHAGEINHLRSLFLAKDRWEDGYETTG